MGLEGLTAARSRIAEIEGRLGGFGGTQTLGGGPQPASSNANFNDVLQAVAGPSKTSADKTVTASDPAAATKVGATKNSKVTQAQIAFAHDLLKKLAYPLTAENIKAITAWTRAEGTDAGFNPLATTRRAPNTTDFNSVGVKNYPSYEDGVNATVATLRNGRYSNILAALAQGNDAMAVARAVERSPWGTGHGVVRALNAN